MFQIDGDEFMQASTLDPTTGNHPSVSPICSTLHSKWFSVFRSVKLTLLSFGIFLEQCFAILVQPPQQPISISWSDSINVASRLSSFSMLL